MFKGIIGYTATKKGKGISFARAYADRQEFFLATDWEKAVDWLTEDKGDAFHIVWALQEFTDVLFTLLPKDVRRQFAENPRVVYGNSRVFYAVDKLLGITATKHIKGNFYQKDENNFYGIKHWLNGIEAPDTAIELAKRGEAIIDALEAMKIYPTKLTSPAGVFSESLGQLSLPTIYSNENLVDSANYCLPIMRNEWRSAYKIGFFDKVWGYDQVAGYPSIMAGLPNTDKCRITYSKHFLKSDWGIMRGTVEITADVSPIVLATGDGHINPSGEWATQMTVDEAIWLKKNGVGRFTMDDGYFFRWLSREKPYEKIMSNLFALRRSNEGLVQSIARNMSQGLSGKLDQDNPDGSYGELFNPILACMTRSRCRLQVADFIYRNNLQDSLVAVIVDGCLTTKPVEIKPTGEMGSWRLDSESSALVLGKGKIWRPPKKPLGVTFLEITEAMRQYPKRGYYEWGARCLDLAMEETNTDRVYGGYPRNGGEALAKIFGSRPIAIKGESGK